LATKVVELDPITRIEGAMKVSIGLDEAGDVQYAHGNVLEFRGFETFLQGRHVSKAPILT
jgi:coenzyme F420-reducing hydrogenase alpha subunit